MISNCSPHADDAMEHRCPNLEERRAGARPRYRRLQPVRADIVTQPQLNWCRASATRTPTISAITRWLLRAAAAASYEFLIAPAPSRRCRDRAGRASTSTLDSAAAQWLALDPGRDRCSPVLRQAAARAVKRRSAVHSPPAAARVSASAARATTRSSCALCSTEMSISA